MKTNSRILPTSITVPLIYKLLSYSGCTHRKCFIRRHVVSLRAKELNLLLFIDAPTCHVLEILEVQVLALAFLESLTFGDVQLTSFLAQRAKLTSAKNTYIIVYHIGDVYDVNNEGFYIKIINRQT